MELPTNWALVEEEARSKSARVPPMIVLCAVCIIQTDTDKKLLIT